MSVKNPVFILSSGRSGSQMLYKLLGSIDGVNSNHEHNIMSYKPEVILYKHTGDTKDLNRLNNSLEKFYFKNIQASNDLWVDSNYSIAPIMDIILKKYPNARVIHLIRSGVKVVSSWLNKLGGEIYGDEEMKSLIYFLRNSHLMSPPKREKKFWWYIPSPNEKIKFEELSQFEKICYHWNFTYKWVENSRKYVSSKSNFKMFKLEEIVSDTAALKSLFDFIDIEYSEKYFKFIQRPHNVNKPVNYKLSKEQIITFTKICGLTMNMLDYDINDQYQVEY